ncbi:MAG TPA: hypothetical protein VFS91_04240 [Nitrobacter sp.]|nr:hypothetical protein [Nitrobacter sp.]
MPLPLLAAGVMAGGSILGGLLGKSSAKKAARSQETMLREALGLQERMFNQGREDLAPWREAGAASLGDAMAMLRPGYDHTTSPGYDFRLGEGLRAVENSAAARGILQSGGTLKGIDRYAEGMAASDFGDRFNRLSTLAGMGSAATGQGVSAGQAFANAGSNIYGQIGQARASGYAGQNQALQGSLGNLFSLYSMGGFGKGF